MTDRKSTKLFIPHPVEPNCSIVGILTQQAPKESTDGRKVALILHGTLGHKDNLFFKRLAARLPFDSFRFDFRGNHETQGSFRHGGLDGDLVDLATVVEYLKSDHGYVIDMLVGHSRGSICAFYWLSTSEEGKGVSSFVNVSGRYRMRKIYDNPNAAAWKAAFDTQGFYEWNTKVAGNQVVGKIYPEDVEEFANWDTSIVWDRFPPAIDVLTLHGLSDITVPPYDALIYARALGKRTPGTHNLHLVEGADHNFTSMQVEVVDTILEWLDAREKGDLITGLWMTGVRGKL